MITTIYQVHAGNTLLRITCHFVFELTGKLLACIFIIMLTDYNPEWNQMQLIAYSPTSLEKKIGLVIYTEIEFR